MSSSLALLVSLLASVRADPNPLPNGDPDAAGLLASSCAAGSGLNELSNLKGVEPNGVEVGVSCLAAKGDSEVVLVPNGLGDGWLPLPNALPPLLLPAKEANPPCLAKPAKPPEDGALDSFPALGDACAPLPNGLPLFLFAKLEKPDWPNAGVGPPPAAQGDVLMPSWPDCPKPTADGFPKAAFGVAGALPKVLEPKVAPPELAAPGEAAPPQADAFCPN